MMVACTISDYSFITGDGFKNRCKFIYDKRWGLKINEAVNNQHYFVRTNCLFNFLEKVVLQQPITLFTHNCDFHIDKKYLPVLDNPMIKKWYAAHVELKHPKLISIPLGLANHQWPHGNIDVLKEVMNLNLSKNRYVVANYSLETNYDERQKCLDATQVQLEPHVGFKEYLLTLAQSRFVISPNGNGIDCHRHWEALYLKTIPIVTDSINIRFYRNYPFLVIKDWSEFRRIKLTKQLYKSIWNNFDIKNLSIEKFGFE